MPEAQAATRYPERGRLYEYDAEADTLKLIFTRVRHVSLDTQIAAVKRRMDTLLDAMIDKGFDDSVTRGKYEALKTELVTLEVKKDRQQCTQEKTLARYQVLSKSVESLRHFGELWEDMEEADKPAFLRGILDRVVMHAGSNATTFIIHLLLCK